MSSFVQLVTDGWIHYFCLCVYHKFIMLFNALVGSGIIFEVVNMK